MKSDDEIKKGLELCYEGIECSECPYVDDCFGNDEIPFGAVMPDALALIQQLEADNAQQARCIENLTDKLNAAHAETVKLQAERDAAVKCLRRFGCAYCLYDSYDAGAFPCACCEQGHDMWEWRGVQKEE